MITNSQNAINLLVRTYMYLLSCLHQYKPECSRAVLGTSSPDDFDLI